MNKDRLTFEEACKELQVSEDELEQLVASGEIAGIKEGDTFFFKKEVVQHFKKNRKTEPTIILADEDMELLDVMDEINLDASPKAAQPAKPPAPAPKAAPQPQASAGDLLSFDEETTLPGKGEDEVAVRGKPQPAGSRSPAGEGAGAPEDTVLNLDGLLEDDGSEATTPIPSAELSAKMVDESSDLTVEGNVNDETLLDTDLLELGEEEDSFKLDTTEEAAVGEPTEATLLRGGGARAMQMKRKKDHAVFTVMLVITALLFLAPLGITLNTVFIAKQEAVPDRKVESIYEWVLWLHRNLGGAVEGIADLFG